MHKGYISVGPVGKEEGRRMMDHKSSGGAHPDNWPGRVPAKPHPDTKYSGSENPGITSSRPVARSNPDLGKGDIEEGVSFRVPMGEQSDPYSG
jgi:hypothetical protein